MNTIDETRYDIFLSEGPLSFHWRLTDRGITLAGGHIRWSANGAARERALSDITSIHLQRAMAGGGDTIGLCLIGFRDGSTLNAHGGAATGLIDSAQADAWTAFVRELHRRLSPDDRRRTTFHTGIAGTRHVIYTAAMAGGALVFVAVPITLFVLERTWEVFVLLAGALGFAWPAWRNYRKNQPRTYDPAHLPEDLL